MNIANAFRRPLGRVAINMRPARGPWGGSSPFVTQLQAFLEDMGYEVGFRLSRKTDLVVLIDPRRDLQNKAFGLEDVIELKRAQPRIKVLHRVNECDKRKGTDFMDALLADANQYADYTVFISDWLREHHSEKWFDRGKDHSVVYNGADVRDYNPIGKVPYGDGPLRIVTHHWSDNQKKGFSSYLWLDREIADGNIQNCQLVVVGRWPKDANWRSAELHPPLTGRPLAEVLKTCHAYVTASVWEPCGMHHVEGAQCGLPVLFHKDGGGINEMCMRYGIEFDDETLAASIDTLRENYADYERKALIGMPSGTEMCMKYLKVIQYLLTRSAWPGSPGLHNCAA